MYNFNIIKFLLIILIFIFILFLIYNNNLNKIEHLTLIQNINNINNYRAKRLITRITNIIENNPNSIELTDISKIINIYQEKYKNSNCSGIGDFIRGSYFVIQFSKKFNINYEIIINHPISNYLKNKVIIDNSLTNSINHIQTFIAISPTNNIIKHENIEEYNKDKIDDIIIKFKDSIREEYNNNKNKDVYFSTNQYPIYKIQEERESGTLRVVSLLT
jgi:hypothetical protein